MASYEIGVVYQRGSRYFIAVDDKTLVCCAGGDVSKVQPTTQYQLVRSISVEKLCEEWGIELDTFDFLMADYLAPPQDTVKTRPRGSRIKKDEAEDYWKRHRTGRIAKPSL